MCPLRERFASRLCGFKKKRRGGVLKHVCPQNTQANVIILWCTGVSASESPQASPPVLEQGFHGFIKLKTIIKPLSSVELKPHERTDSAEMTRCRRRAQHYLTARSGFVARSHMTNFWFPKLSHPAITIDTTVETRVFLISSSIP